MKKILVGAAVAVFLTLGVAAPGMAEGKAYGKNFTAACGSTWGDIVSNGQPRTPTSTHYRMGYKGGLQGIMNDPGALAFHAEALCG